MLLEKSTNGLQGPVLFIPCLAHATCAISIAQKREKHEQHSRAFGKKNVGYSHSFRTGDHFSVLHVTEFNSASTQAS